MNSGLALFLAFGIGVVAGLRSMTAPAIVAWAAHLGWISLSSSHLAFMGSARAVGIFTLGALAEFVADQLPTIPARTTAGPVAARIVMGSLTGACLGTAGGASLWLGALIGAIGAIAGGFGGYQARVRLVQSLHLRDIAIAIPEDLIAIGLGLFLVQDSESRQFIPGTLSVSAPNTILRKSKCPGSATPARAEDRGEPLARDWSLPLPKQV